MKIRPITIDFETEPIRNRPHYPPKPVSVSIKLPEWRAPKFFAWEHKTGGNNVSYEDAKRVLIEAYAQASPATPLLCHNAKFDLDVAEVHFGLVLPDWRCFHDTMFLLFLDDPHQRSLGLKPSAERILDTAPEEREYVVEWVLTHKKQLEQDYPEIIEVYGGIKPSTAGAFIAYAPGSIVGSYANGDVIRTEKLFKAKYSEVTVTRGMGAAYDRERKLLPILLRNEREGIRIDEAALARDQVIYERAQIKVDDWLRKTLKSPGLDLDKDNEVAKALDAADMITQWTMTATGRKSVSKKNMKLSHFRCKKVAAAYSYRQKCATMLETFIRPWQHYSKNGWMHTTWNQVRQSKGSGVGGTRTGRPSTDSPNFLNVPRNMKEQDLTGGFIMPTHIRDLPMIPKVRGYILADDKKSVIVKRDFDSQELRITAHFEERDLLQAYLKNPHLDVHEFTRQQIKLIAGMDIDRPFVKTLNFGFLYGMGLGKLAESLELTVNEVKAIRNAQMQALPGLKALNDDIKARFKAGDCVRTWGGRQYFCEPPIMIDGKKMTFEYKGLNYIVQSSAADITKEVLIRYDEQRKSGRMAMTVYDEVDLSAPKKAAKSEALILRECMLSIELDVPLTSGCEIGPNFGDVVEVKESAYDLSRWGL